MTFNKVYFILCLLCFMGLCVGKCNWLINDHKTIQFVFCVLLVTGQRCVDTALSARNVSSWVQGERGTPGNGGPGHCAGPS